MTNFKSCYLFYIKKYKITGEREGNVINIVNIYLSCFRCVTLFSDFLTQKVDDILMSM